MVLNSSTPLLVVCQVWNCGPSHNPLLWWCDGGFNGRSEAADLHGLLAEFGNSS